MCQLMEYIPGRIWLKEYPVHYAGTDFNARMTVIRLSDSRIMLHSPCEIDNALKEEISALGKTAYIIAPGSYLQFTEDDFASVEKAINPFVYE